MKRLHIPLLTALLLTVALAGCSSDKDSDGDGIPDSMEKRGWDVVVYKMDWSSERRVTSDPHKVDTDGDGLDDYAEIFIHGTLGGFLDPSNPDTDGDGLSDCQEWPDIISDCPLLDRFQEYDYQAYDTRPLWVDGDFQSGSFGRYVNFHLNDGRGYIDIHQRGSTCKTTTGQCTYSFGDGLTDYEEIFGYDVVQPDGTVLEGVTSDPALIDSDGDELEDGEEALIHFSDGRVPDTDGDGCMDGIDVFPLRDVQYNLELVEFTLEDAPTGRTQFLWGTFLLGQGRYHPESGGATMFEGETQDISDLSGVPLDRIDCTQTPAGGIATFEATAYFPWFAVQAFAYAKDPDASFNNYQADEDGELYRLDTFTESIPDENPAILYWNPVAERFSWNRPTSFDPASYKGPETFAPATDGSIRLEGDEGILTFRPTVVDAA